jgi:(p)ppGpp synthase/HD superfamily hydrolase
MGFITRGRGITVHGSGCRQALALPPERRVSVQWDMSHKMPHKARLYVVTVDRPLILAKLSEVIGKMDVNITHLEARTTREDRGVITLEVADWAADGWLGRALLAGHGEPLHESPR